jgi:hypothetical protein
MNLDCSVTDYGLKNQGSILGRVFFFAIVSRPTLGPIQPHFQWLPGALFWGLNGQNVKLATFMYCRG